MPTLASLFISALWMARDLALTTVGGQSSNTVEFSLEATRTARSWSARPYVIGSSCVRVSVSYNSTTAQRVDDNAMRKGPFPVIHLVDRKRL
jgi:hypothetical protein